MISICNKFILLIPGWQDTLMLILKLNICNIYFDVNIVYNEIMNRKFSQDIDILMRIYKETADVLTNFQHNTIIIPL